MACWHQDHLLGVYVLQELLAYYGQRRNLTEQDCLGGGPAGYEVEWIIDGMQGGVFTQLPANALVGGACRQMRRQMVT